MRACVVWERVCLCAHVQSGACGCERVCGTGAVGSGSPHTQAPAAALASSTAELAQALHRACTQQDPRPHTPTCRSSAWVPHAAAPPAIAWHSLRAWQAAAVTSGHGHTFGPGSLLGGCYLRRGEAHIATPHAHRPGRPVAATACLRAWQAASSSRSLAGGLVTQRPCHAAWQAASLSRSTQQAACSSSSTAQHPSSSE